ncbi:MAG: aldo/keto reductase [Planctomycetota bacterium]
MLLEVARELGRPPAQVALSWVTRRPGVTSTIIGASKLEQLEQNLQALELELPPELAARLDEASRLDPANPYLFFEQAMRERIDGGVPVRREPHRFR